MKPSMCQMTGCPYMAVGTLRGVPVCQRHGEDIGAKLKMMQNLMSGRKSAADYVIEGQVKMPAVRIEEVLDDGGTRELKRVR